MIVWPFFTAAPVPWMSTAERSLPSGFGVLGEVEAGDHALRLTILGAHAGDGVRLAVGLVQRGLAC